MQRTKSVKPAVVVIGAMQVLGGFYWVLLLSLHASHAIITSQLLVLIVSHTAAPEVIYLVLLY